MKHDPAIKIPKLDAVESSNVKAIGYDADTQILAVHFHSSDVVYLYFKVPADVAAQLREPGISIGSLVGKLIRGKFEFVTRTPPGPFEGAQLPLALVEDETHGE
jgi:hypothetical protein